MNFPSLQSWGEAALSWCTELPWPGEMGGESRNKALRAAMGRGRVPEPWWGLSAGSAPGVVGRGTLGLHPPCKQLRTKELLCHFLFQDMENKIRSTLNEIYFGKTKDIVNGLR